MNNSICFGVVCFAICTMVGLQSEAQIRRGPNKQSPTEQPPSNLVDETEMQEVSGEELDAAYAELEETHAQHYRVLQELRQTLPASAQPAIDKAMQNSEQGWRRAKEARQRIGSRLRKVIDGAKPDSAGKGIRGKEGKAEPSEGDASQGLGNQQGRNDQGRRGPQRLIPGLGLPTIGGPPERIGQGSNGKGPRR